MKKEYAKCPCCGKKLILTHDDSVDTIGMNWNDKKMVCPNPKCKSINVYVKNTLPGTVSGVSVVASRTILWKCNDCGNAWSEIET